LRLVFNRKNSSTTYASFERETMQNQATPNLDVRGIFGPSTMSDLSPQCAAKWSVTRYLLPSGAVCRSHHRTRWLCTIHAGQLAAPWVISRGVPGRSSEVLRNWGARSQHERRLATLPIATQLQTRHRHRCRHAQKSDAGERESCNNERAPFASPSCTFHYRRSCWMPRRIGPGEPFLL